MVKSKLAISVDIEDWYHVPAVTGSSFSEYKDVHEFFDNWKEDYDYLTKPTHRTLDLLDDVNVKATFFIVADVVQNYPGLVEGISDRGHEIGCHGLNHECAIDPDSKKPRFTRKEYKNRVLKAKKILEQASGQKVIGYRAPNAYVGGWMLDVLEEIGFKYDSSVARCSLYNKTDQDLSNVGTVPYIPKKGSLDPGGERDFVELPWSYWKVGPMRIPTAGGPLIRFFGRRIISAGIKQSLKRGDSMFYFHPVDISREDFPKVGNVKRRPAYWMFKGKVAEKRVRKLLNKVNTQFVNCDNIAEKYMDEVTER